MWKEYTGVVVDRTVVSGTPAKQVDWHHRSGPTLGVITDPQEDFPVGAIITVSFKTEE